MLAVVFLYRLGDFLFGFGVEQFQSAFQIGLGQIYLVADNVAFGIDSIQKGR